MPPECKTYKVLSGADRSQGNYLQNLNDRRCDTWDLTLPGWYRFEGAAGDRMLDECVPFRSCGTYAPGWMQGNHPRVDEGVVTRKVCYHYEYNCCRSNNNIRVRNCSAYFVYELQKTLYCPLRYCGNALGKLSSHVSSFGFRLL